MRTLSISRRLAAPALAAWAAALAACNDAPTSTPDGASRREAGVLQLELAGPATTMQADGGQSIPGSGPGSNPAGGGGGGGPRPGGADSSVSSGPIKWDRPPGAGIITAPEVIQVADTVRVGEAVPIVVHTVLPNGCWRTDGEEVRQNGLTVEITPQDARSDAPICTMLYGWGAHRVTARFDTPGTATIRVTGRRVRQGGETTSEPVTAERTVVVR